MFPESNRQRLKTEVINPVKCKSELKSGYYLKKKARKKFNLKRKYENC